MPAFVSSALTSSDSASRPPADEPIATTGNVLPPNGPTPRLSVATSTRAVSGTTVESASPRPTHAHRRRGRNPNCSRSPNIYECGRHLLHSLIDTCSFPVTFLVRMRRDSRLWWRDLAPCLALVACMPSEQSSGDAKCPENFPVHGNLVAETGSRQSAHTANDLAGRRLRLHPVLLCAKGHLSL